MVLQRYSERMGLYNMKKLLLILGVAIAIVVLSSCEESSGLMINSENFKIELLYSCGWCAGVEQLTLSESAATYAHDYACGEQSDIPETSITISDSVWAQYLNNIDIDSFQSLEIDNCGVCYDWCDYTLKMSDSTFNHSIRFVNTDEITHAKTKILAEELINILNEKSDEFHD